MKWLSIFFISLIIAEMCDSFDYHTMRNGLFHLNISALETDSRMRTSANSDFANSKKQKINNLYDRLFCDYWGVKSPNNKPDGKTRSKIPDPKWKPYFPAWVELNPKLGDTIYIYSYHTAAGEDFDSFAIFKNKDKALIAYNPHKYDENHADQNPPTTLINLTMPQQDQLVEKWDLDHFKKIGEKYKAAAPRILGGYKISIEAARIIIDGSKSTIDTVSYGYLHKSPWPYLQIIYLN